jgi:CTP synthase (UTP-ammonia lyase)
VSDCVEPYYCNYGVNPDYGRELEAHGLRISGVGETGEVRLIEIPDHPFFMATLFLPQARSKPAEPHPLLRGFAAAVLDRR